ncbi:MAG: reverse transcriptase domain-containing protein [Chloroflexota bacterium]
MNVNHQLLDTLHILGTRGEPVYRLYARMLDEDLFIASYIKLYPNKGAMTPGSDPKDSIDGMSLQRIRRLIDTLKNNRWRWKPSRRTTIPKRNGKSRPLSMPNWSDKLVQDVMRTVLTAYYEPVFRDESHGFRPKRGCHTALNHIKHVWTGVNWFVEGDIEGCFDNIDHLQLLQTIGKRIRDFRFMKLLRTMLKAGYIEKWKMKPSLAGTPQGGVVSPLLANIFLHQLDEYVVSQLKPNFDKGIRKRVNQIYQKLQNAITAAIQKDDYDAARRLRVERRKVPSRAPKDDSYRRLVYIRYADDFMLGIIGTKDEAKQIKSMVGAFLDSIKLKLSPEKTKITHATTGRARFLGYDIYKHSGKYPHRNRSGRIQLKVPKDRLSDMMSRYLRHGKPIHRRELAYASDAEIIRHYDSELRGYYNYYRLASDVSHRIGYLKLVMHLSLAKTLANKHKSSVAKVYRRYGKNGTVTGRRILAAFIKTKSGNKAISFGDYSLRRQTIPNKYDQDPYLPALPYKELTQRLNATKCELCGKQTTNVEVHHIKRMQDIRKQVRAGRKERWQEVMAYRNRKTLVVCHNCHQQIHYPRNGHSAPESRVK